MTYYVVGANASLNAKQVGAVRGNIIFEIERFIDADVLAPSFNSHRLGESELELKCADNRTAEWLKSIVPRLRPWNGASLKLLTKREWDAMNKPQRMLRMTVVSPWRVSAAYFMKVLRSHNPQLRTRQWEIKHVEDRGERTKFYLKVDETSVGILRAKGFKAFWLVDALEFRLEKPRQEADKDRNEKRSTLANRDNLEEQAGNSDNGCQASEELPTGSNNSATPTRPISEGASASQTTGTVNFTDGDSEEQQTVGSQTRGGTPSGKTAL